ncbi:MAG TPA: hypothetical protein VFE12_16520 [Acetobacteraceae bacterium]|nr:hypothetical protein [Acetobacteraceae bacterium]
MLIDKQNQFSADAGDSPTGTGSTASSNIVDLGIARDIGGALTDQLALLCEVVTAFASGGSATLQVQFQTAPDNGSGAPGSWSTLAQSDVIAVAALTQGYKVLPNEVPGGTQRFVRLNYVIGTAAMTAGTLKAALVPSLDVQPEYARGYVA